VFTLHERLARACAEIGDLPLCRVLLLNDRRFAWLLLVPRRDGIEEIADLEKADRAQLIEEIAQA
jgi:diadenosine tetraphosphate (Ap4A) HIT family hydrolase